jgi:transposase
VEGDGPGASVCHRVGQQHRLDLRFREIIELAWLWLRHQPQSALALGSRTGQTQRRPSVALARKLRVALWKYVTAAVFIEGAVMKVA